MVELEKIVWNTKSHYSPDGRVSLQAIRDKLGRNHAWPVMKSRINWNSEQFEFDVEKGAGFITEVISFKNAWAEFGWDDVKFVDKQTTNEGIIPVVNSI